MILIKSNNDLYFINDPKDDESVMFRVSNDNMGTIIDFDCYPITRSPNERQFFDPCVIIINSSNGVYFSYCPVPTEIKWSLIPSQGKTILGFISANTFYDIYVVVFYKDGTVIKASINDETHRKIAYKITNGRLIFDSGHDSLWIISGKMISRISIDINGNLSKNRVALNPSGIKNISSISSYYTNAGSYYILRDDRNSVVLSLDDNSSESRRVGNGIYSNDKIARNILDGFSKYTVISGTLRVTNIETGRLIYKVGQVRDVAISITKSKVHTVYLIFKDGSIGIVSDEDSDSEEESDYRPIAKFEMAIDNPKFSDIA